MSTYFLAMMLLSAGSFIRTRSAAPEMRPASAASDMVWGWAATASFWMWLGLIVWGFLTLHWSQPLAAVMASLAVNAVIGIRGPMRTWPGLSMMFCIAGLLSGAVTLLN
ncbi:multidrug DMT transporter permease [Roseomonas eburnea]|uniref:Multidrug DMT transporter permease n=1 Tax=Neoroseomonas eburnea TaxID=1346889 RepID=A0A9X9XID9_9PROT|nr:multidrug DMT transporter permease [Neoroseomonas eburnea]MBR0683475.1 multidrug DMT transporter permease [Neoroseomonas eburnea]